MKKKILVTFTGAMELGGIEKSLLGLLDSINYDEYEVDLFLYSRRGPLFKYINSNVNILPEVKELAYLRCSLKDKLVHGCFYSAWRRVIDGFCKIGNDASWKKVLDRVMDPLPTEYDIALGFFAPFDILRDYVNAKIKVAWVHTDYSNSNELSIDYLRETYRDVDFIAGVSDQCSQVFGEVMPKYREKTVTVENVLPKSLVLNQSNESLGDEMTSGEVKLLSIGRYCTAKNFDNIPEITKMIRESGVDAKWYIIGYGSDEPLIRSKIAEFGMEDHVILLEKKENPYPYIKACDIYVQPSRYEGKCVAVREAQMLCKPVIITNYKTAQSQLDDGIDGVVVPMDNRGCAEGIVNVIRDKELRECLIANCRKRDYSNMNSTAELLQMLDTKSEGK